MHRSSLSPKPAHPATQVHSEVRVGAGINIRTSPLLNIIAVISFPRTSTSITWTPNPPITITTTTTTLKMSDSEEDYMKMTFPPSPSHTKSTTTAPPETSLQRRARLRREAEARSRPKSKSELLAEADRRREAAHATSLLNDPSTSAPSKSKGLAMMAKMGFTGGALGASTSAAAAATEPIRVDIKDGREGIGLESERKRKLREAAEAAGEQVKKARVGEEEYRERVRREREAGRLERQVGAAQKVAEGMEGGEGESGMTLKAVPVEYRGLVRRREEAERERRMRYDLEQAVMRSSKLLPGYDDGEEDEDDRRALGKGKAATTYVVAEDLDEEDEELEAFEALEPEERLRRVVEYLRREHRYCFWCKCAYPDEEMDGCPGLTEEDHD